MKKIIGLRVGFGKSSDSPNQAADRAATLDDLQFSIDCVRELKYLEETENPLIYRALWEASLISFRRSMANSQTMGPDSGGLEKPFSRKDYRSVLPSSMHESFEKYCHLADKMVAHRIPIKDVREMCSVGVIGIESQVSITAVPEMKDVMELINLVECIYEAIIDG